MYEFSSNSSYSQRVYGWSVCVCACVRACVRAWRDVCVRECVRCYQKLGAISHPQARVVKLLKIRTLIMQKTEITSERQKHMHPVSLRILQNLKYIITKIQNERTFSANSSRIRRNQLTPSGFENMARLSSWVFVKKSGRRPAHIWCWIRNVAFNFPGPLLLDEKGPCMQAFDYVLTRSWILCLIVALFGSWPPRSTWFSKNAESGALRDLWLCTFCCRSWECKKKWVPRPIKVVEIEGTVVNQTNLNQERRRNLVTPGELANSIPSKTNTQCLLWSNKIGEQNVAWPEISLQCNIGWKVCWSAVENWHCQWFILLNVWHCFF